MLLLTACAPMAQLVRAPYAPLPLDSDAPENAVERGEVRFRDAEVWGEAGRPQAEWLMHRVCGGPYRIESEEPERGTGPGWKRATFTCVR